MELNIPKLLLLLKTKTPHAIFHVELLATNPIFVPSKTKALIFLLSKVMDAKVIFFYNTTKIKTSTQDTRLDSIASVHINTIEFLPTLISVYTLFKTSNTSFLATTNINNYSVSFTCFNRLEFQYFNFFKIIFFSTICFFLILLISNLYVTSPKLANKKMKNGRKK